MREADARVKKADMIVVAVGAVLLGIAVGGATFTTEVAQANAPFVVAFPESTTDLGTRTRTTTGEGDAVVAFQVTSLNVTRLTFTAHARALTGPDGAVTIRAESPDGTAFGAAGPTLVVDVATPPEAVQVRARGPAAVSTPAANATGQGTWTLTVTVDPEVPGPVPHHVTTHAVVAHYAAAVAPAD